MLIYETCIFEFVEGSKFHNYINICVLLSYFINIRYGYYLHFHKTVHFMHYYIYVSTTINGIWICSLCTYIHTFRQIWFPAVCIMHTYLQNKIIVHRVLVPVLCPFYSNKFLLQYAKLLYVTANHLLPYQPPKFFCSLRYKVIPRCHWKDYKK